MIAEFGREGKVGRVSEGTRMMVDSELTSESNSKRNVSSDEENVHHPKKLTCTIKDHDKQ